MPSERFIDLGGKYIDMDKVVEITPMMVGGIVLRFSGGGETRVSDWPEIREALGLPPNPRHADRHPLDMDNKWKENT
jgi:hypothetical protein